MSEQVIVTGSRNWDKPQYIWKVLSDENPELVIQGGAKGADEHADHWTKICERKGMTIFAQWNKFGKRAGIVRNEQMLDLYPFATVHAFLRDGSKGTTHCIFAAKERGMNVRVHHYENV